MNFELTSEAYKVFSNKMLKQKRFYLKLMRINALIIAGKFFLELFDAIKLPTAWFFKRTIFPVFCGGEDIEQSLIAVKALSKRNILCVLDYSVEGLKNESGFENTVKEVKKSILVASQDRNIPFSVFKPTAIASEMVLSGNAPETADDFIKFRDRINEIASYAHKLDVKLMIDAEDYIYQDLVDKEVERLMKEFNQNKTIVFTTIQMYRKDRLSYLDKLLSNAKRKEFFVGVKLVRGAYMEKERLLAKKHNYSSPICDSKEDTDLSYNKALKVIIDNIETCELFAGTHNEESCSLLANLIRSAGLLLNDKRVYFAQLFGMSDNISNTLANSGYNVVKYVPYGPVNKVIPYLMRRADENSSVSQQSKREILLINRELKNRKNGN